ncbi:hypothetical protein, partial [Streptomyces sp. NPDC056491]|uniref:hypothetical protein n=1 Tax=Streptomyces sp. NPDC056491 TaxID=3345837 RepID=UPI0036C41917
MKWTLPPDRFFACFTNAGRSQPSSVTTSRFAASISLISFAGSVKVPAEFSFFVAPARKACCRFVRRRLDDDHRAPFPAGARGRQYGRPGVRARAGPWCAAEVGGVPRVPGGGDRTAVRVPYEDQVHPALGRGQPAAGRQGPAVELGGDLAGGELGAVQAGVGDLDVMPVGGEARPQGFGEALFVFDHEDAHGPSVTYCRCPAVSVPGARRCATRPGRASALRAARAGCAAGRASIAGGAGVGGRLGVVRLGRVAPLPVRAARRC